MYNRIPAIRGSQCVKGGSSPHRRPPQGADWEETGHLSGTSEEGGKAFWRKRDLRWTSKDLTVKEQKAYLQQRKGEEKGRRGEAMSSKVGLNLRVGRGRVKYNTHTLCVIENRGGFGAGN